MERRRRWGGGEGGEDRRTPLHRQADKPEKQGASILDLQAFKTRPQRVLKVYWATRSTQRKPEKQGSSILEIQAFTHRRCSRETRSRTATG